MKTNVTLKTERLIIRPWTLSESDRNFFHLIHSDKDVRRFYPELLDRKSADERLEALVARASANAFDWGVACLKDTGEQLGFTGLAHVNYETPFTPAVETGWMYARSAWGKGYATEAALALLSHGFEDLKLPEIVAFAVHNNHASISVMKRIGLIHDTNSNFDHPRVPDSQGHLRRHVLYRLTFDQWASNQTK